MKKLLASASLLGFLAIAVPSLGQTVTTSCGAEVTEYENAGSVIRIKPDEPFNPSMPIRLRVGQSLVVELYKQSGTGHFWEFSGLNTDVLAVEYIKIVAACSISGRDVVGLGEVEVFRLKAQSSGTASVTFYLKRARSEPVRSISLNFLIGDI